MTPRFFSDAIKRLEVTLSGFRKSLQAGNQGVALRFLG